VGPSDGCSGSSANIINCSFLYFLFLYVQMYSKTCLKRKLKGPEHFSAEARFPFNQGTVWQSRDLKIFPFKTKFRLLKGTFKTGFTVYIYFFYVCANIVYVFFILIRYYYISWLLVNLIMTIQLAT
jgi:hypothetical protein